MLIEMTISIRAAEAPLLREKAKGQKAKIKGKNFVSFCPLPLPLPLPYHHCISRWRLASASTHVKTFRRPRRRVRWSSHERIPLGLAVIGSTGTAQVDFILQRRACFGGVYLQGINRARGPARHDATPATSALQIGRECRGCQRRRSCSREMTCPARSGGSRVIKRPPRPPPHRRHRRKPATTPPP